MFPKTENPDLLFLKVGGGRDIPCAIAVDFESPEILVGLWYVTTGRASVPETTVYEHSNPVPGKEKIWIPFKSSWPHFPSADARAGEGEPQPAFGRPIVFSMHCAHSSRTLRRGPLESSFGQLFTQCFFHRQMPLSKKAERVLIRQSAQAPRIAWRKARCRG